MKFFKTLFLAITFLLILSPQSFALTISPSLFEIQTEPGVPQTFTLNVYNDGQRKYNIKSYIWDLSFNRKNKKTYKPPSGKAESIAKYINLSDKNFILEPKENKVVSFTITIPKGVIGGKQAIAFFDATPIVPKDNAPVRLLMTASLGVTILQETKGTVEIKSRIKSVKFINPNTTNPLIMELNVVNQGNTHIFGSAVVAITKGENTFIGSFRVPGTIIFPKKSALLKGSFEGDIQPGAYNALITYHFRDKDIVITKNFTVN
ncbi:MAG: hypothetical protein H7263_07565 [Candidatus Sericytochromatia bacterium]|nr:hypothetical protein [Candidatus Sericytochromatia bacterium]